MRGMRSRKIVAAALLGGLLEHPRIASLLEISFEVSGEENRWRVIRAEIGRSGSYADPPKHG